MVNYELFRIRSCCLTVRLFSQCPALRCGFIQRFILLYAYHVLLTTQHISLSGHVAYFASTCALSEQRSRNSLTILVELQSRVDLHHCASEGIWLLLPICLRSTVDENMELDLRTIHADDLQRHPNSYL